MRTTLLSTGLSFLLFCTLVFLPSETAAKEQCPKENCLVESQCESVVSNIICPNKGDACCSIVKSEFRTHCRHHGGECFDKCAKSLQRNAIDCSTDTVCCVLV